MKINFNPKFANFEIENKFYRNYFPEIANPKTYSSLVEIENSKKITFPRWKPKKIVLYSNHNLLKNKYELKPEESFRLLKILNDSTKYEWGELGTLEVHYYFKYFDENNNLIGITKIDEEGMAYSEPYLIKMKWCRLKNINEVNDLIREIEK
ncbi:hypothetical protein [Riemerella anatipestifer]|uniref:Uncharacterized protein n=1 Tax=Riemerella anatipestifer RA-CH-1 TaxID=1228997 RepID=J9R366_RIEAN|nr:hypothetical protein [Riemerella anatipestifer]AFR34853.1 hypothetical protein B739_0246 [Riemerella anatipestifer RA-CH-1]AIH01854.1 hypothetical protein M949_0683 [Riemerella anatipestifer CH3]MCO7332467.1 hypothetical protein [Riemerella anatipestifer]MCO7351351.1 hypothetical protein [Riemerella anatipestifer]MCU7583196.1 hypothetical protein [Riemerella anatipestifer]